jgi:hypothetical protein
VRVALLLFVFVFDLLLGHAEVLLVGEAPPRDVGRSERREEEPDAQRELQTAVERGVGGGAERGDRHGRKRGGDLGDRAVREPPDDGDLRRSEGDRSDGAEREDAFDPRDRVQLLGLELEALGAEGDPRLAEARRRDDDRRQEERGPGREQRRRDEMERDVEDVPLRGRSAAKAQGAFERRLDGFRQRLARKAQGQDEDQKERRGGRLLRIGQVAARPLAVEPPRRRVFGAFVFVRFGHGAFRRARSTP